eukprot:jgi/Hompol1/3826/HPOL_003366-RA
MATLNISVKWNGTKYDVQTDTTQPGLVLKTQLFSLTGVAPDRQKIMVKGGMLKDDTLLSSLGLKEGQQLMMMGTVGELPKAPEKPVQFMEDMTDAQIAQALKLPAGLTNLGNTCYLNATIQCLRAAPELMNAMQKIDASFGQDPYSNLTLSMRSMMRDLDTSGDEVTPMVFVQVLRSVFPQFAERNNQGYMQQDAEECWGQIVQALAENVPGLTVSGDVDKTKRFVAQFMTTEVLSTITCDEAPEEVPTENIETFNKLRVNIGAGVSTYLVSEIAASLVEKIEKNSPSLGRSAIYSKKSKITRLPQYLAINFVRFQWKPTERVKAKILKVLALHSLQVDGNHFIDHIWKHLVCALLIVFSQRVQFPFELDMSTFCTQDLQEKFAPAKQRIKEVADRKAEEKKLKKAQAMAAGAGASTSTAADVQMEDAASTSAKPDPHQRHLAVIREIGLDASLINDPGVNPSGQYDLVAVLTHVGRAADSGHYIGWVKQHNGDKWWKFDDEKVSQVNQEDITKLEGGGDWHTAYICLYAAKKLE